MTIDRNSLMHYSLLGEDDALTQAEVRKVVHLYLEEHFDGNRQHVKWPKEIKDMCSSLGIVQSRDTGFPSDETGVHVAKEQQRTFIKEENEILRRENQQLKDALNNGFKIWGAGQAEKLFDQIKASNLIAKGNGSCH